jgi:hypothetical protein
VYIVIGGFYEVIFVYQAKKKFDNLLHLNNVVLIIVCKQRNNDLKVRGNFKRIYSRSWSVIDAGYGEKVLFAAVDEEAADENETSKIEDEVC